MPKLITDSRLQCPDCSTVWPLEPERPSLVGKCSGCRREYQRRWQNEHYATAEGRQARRRQSRDHYERNRLTFNDKHLRRALKDLGLSMEDYQAMLAEQEGKCAICGEVESGRFSRLAIDHDHATGEVRGLLCGRCNKAIGLLRDSTMIVSSVLNYLTRERV